MKAQISIDFIIAVIVFVLFGAYVFFQLIQYPPKYMNQIESQRFMTEVYQISELLINDPGEPPSWGSGNVKRIGLSLYETNKTNLLDGNKINEFNTMSYDEVRSKLSISSEYEFSISLKNIQSGEILFNCVPSKEITRERRAEISRIVAFDSGGYGELIVQLW
jgi:hypothetical protein